MTWINIIEKEKAQGSIKEVYSNIEKEHGKLSNIMKAQSLDPNSLKNHLDLYLSVMFNETTLKREERELISVVVSVLNNCSYCINHHAEALNKFWKDEEKVKRLIANYKKIDFSIRELAILNYAEKLTVTPGLVTEIDIQNLRIHNISDEEILNINLIVSYFNFVNRIANGLGVEFSEDEVMGYNE
ncbi:MAG: peroxidase [Ignavibacteriae bacterium]|nr:MAG: peroxidase [Ignavibacteriota bacterium]